MTETPLLLEIAPLDLGAEVRAVGLELTEVDENREPARGPDAARVWSRILPAVAGDKPWAFDFFSHLDRVRDYCTAHNIPFRDATERSLVIPAPVGASDGEPPEAIELELLLTASRRKPLGRARGRTSRSLIPLSRANWRGVEWTPITPDIPTTFSARYAPSRMARWFC